MGILYKSKDVQKFQNAGTIPLVIPEFTGGLKGRMIDERTGKYVVQDNVPSIIKSRKQDIPIPIESSLLGGQHAMLSQDNRSQRDRVAAAKFAREVDAVKRHGAGQALAGALADPLSVVGDIGNDVGLTNDFGSKAAAQDYKIRTQNPLLYKDQQQAAHWQWGKEQAAPIAINTGMELATAGIGAAFMSSAAGAGLKRLTGSLINKAVTANPVLKKGAVANSIKSYVNGPSYTSRGNTGVTTIPSSNTMLGFEGDTSTPKMKVPKDLLQSIFGKPVEKSASYLPYKDQYKENFELIAKRRNTADREIAPSLSTARDRGIRLKKEQQSLIDEIATYEGQPGFNDKVIDAEMNLQMIDEDLAGIEAQIGGYTEPELNQAIARQAVDDMGIRRARETVKRNYDDVADKLKQEELEWLRTHEAARRAKVHGIDINKAINEVEVMTHTVNEGRNAVSVNNLIPSELNIGGTQLDDVAIDISGKAKLDGYAQIGEHEIGHVLQNSDILDYNSKNIGTVFDSKKPVIDQLESRGHRPAGTIAELNLVNHLKTKPNLSPRAIANHNYFSYSKGARDFPKGSTEAGFNGRKPLREQVSEAGPFVREYRAGLKGLGLVEDNATVLTDDIIKKYDAARPYHRINSFADWGDKTTREVFKAVYNNILSLTGAAVVVKGASNNRGSE